MNTPNPFAGAARAPRFQAVLVLAATLILTGSLGAQTVLFNQTLTGTQLEASSDVTLAAGYSISGSSLVFAANTHDKDQVLLHWSLLDADLTRGDLRIVVTVDFDTLTPSDWEPGLMISDGVHFQGIHRGDNGNRAVLMSGDVAGDYSTLANQVLLSSTQTIVQGLSGLSTLSYTFDIAAGAGGTIESAYTEGGYLQTNTFTYTTDNLTTSNALSFDFISAGYNGDEEGYQLNSVGVAIYAAVPEPATIAWWTGLALLPLLALRIRRRMTAERA
ncbi:hypothetical protein [Actomonas aquatica]|uniref:PEP-CTERM protein-sorting domain-containing protein n=1 Tax=Actomonas aquatica TaxID=2866162 RepID=A0ABZ1C2R0_9BACT|nr:hypothetical protein [Opitutus sp. WL0086]WRQ85991.1 hypothetical protein K1X11_014350 [Opitutus sp. WL0086]